MWTWPHPLPFATIICDNSTEQPPLTLSSCSLGTHEEWRVSVDTDCDVWRHGHESRPKRTGKSVIHWLVNYAQVSGDLHRVTKSAWRVDYARRCTTPYQPLNCLSECHEFRYRSALWTAAWASCRYVSHTVGAGASDFLHLLMDFGEIRYSRLPLMNCAFRENSGGANHFYSRA